MRVGSLADGRNQEPGTVVYSKPTDVAGVRQGLESAS
jgi:hypothetical protein